MAFEPEAGANRTEAAALGDLALCESLAQVAAWVARWSSQVAQADGALVWAPDAALPLFVCIAAEGDAPKNFVKRSASRETGVVHDLLRDRRPIALERAEFAPNDPWVQGMPQSVKMCLAIPLEKKGTVVGLLCLLFSQTQKSEEKLGRLKPLLAHAAPALARATRAERKTIGMLHAIERLTNLYDLSKAFGSTIDLTELNQIIARKAVDFGAAELSSFWLLEGETADLVLAATAVNENYDVENTPDAVGGTIVGDLLVDRRVIRRNNIPPDDSLALENAGYPIRSVLAFPLVEDDRAVGALVLANKRGRHPEFSAEDEELLQDLCRQAVRALRNARQHEAEKKVEELDALLAVSREITATLDLDKVMQKIVNATAALINYDRSAIAILDKGRLRLGAVSGSLDFDRKDPQHRATQEILEWVFFSGSDFALSQDASGRIETDRPETEEKFRAYFAQSGIRYFHGLILSDEEGKLGVLAFERKKPLAFDENQRDLLAILVNQATVAVRNAQLYKQITLPGFLRPLAGKRRKFLEIPLRRRIVWGLGAVALAILLFVVPWPLRIAGPARILPGRRAAVTAGVDGTILTVLHHEGDTVQAGEVIATIDPESYKASLADARAAYQIAESEIARHREAGDSAALFEASSRRDELKARIALEEDRFAHTSLRAPISGVLVTPRIEERVGQLLIKGSELCVVADVASVSAEVAVDETDASLVRAGQPVSLKLNPYPTRIFRGTVARGGSHVRQEGKESFVVAEVRVDNPSGQLKTGMQGKAKVSTGRVPVAVAIFRKPARFVWSKIWPLLP